MTTLSSIATPSQADLAYGRAQAATAQLSGRSDTASLRKASQNFETVFISQMFSHMFEGIKADSMFGGGHGEEMFRSLLVDEYAKQVVKKGGIGIADSVMRTLISQQEKA